MNKKARLALLIAFVFCATIAFSGCGAKFDAAGYITEALNAYQSGTVSDKLADLSSESKEELQEQIDDVRQEITDSFVSIVDEEYQTDEIKEYAERTTNAILSQMKYEVSDQVEETDNGFVVTVKAYPMESINNIQSAILGSDYEDEWAEKAKGYTSMDDLMKDFYPDMMSKIADYFENPENVTYGDPQDTTIRVEIPEGSEYYEANEDDIEKLFNIIYGL